MTREIPRRPYRLTVETTTTSCTTVHASRLLHFMITVTRNHSPVLQVFFYSPSLQYTSSQWSSWLTVSEIRTPKSAGRVVSQPRPSYRRRKVAGKRCHRKSDRDFFSPASSRFFCRSTNFPRCSGSTRLLLENGDHPLIVRFFFSSVATSEEKTEPAGPGNREPWTADAVAALTRESRFEQPFGRPRFHSAALGSAPRDTSRVARAAWIKVGVTSRRGGIRRQCGGTGGFSLSLINPFSFLLAPSLLLLSLNMYYCYSILAVIAILFKILFNGNLKALKESGKRVIIKA